jgi:hypothetical protein
VKRSDEDIKRDIVAELDAARLTPGVTEVVDALTLTE